MLSLGKEDLLKKAQLKQKKKLKVQKRIQQDKQIKPFEFYPPEFVKKDPVKMLATLKQMKIMPL